MSKKYIHYLTAAVFLFNAAFIDVAQADVAHLRPVAAGERENISLETFSFEALGIVGKSRLYSADIPDFQTINGGDAADWLDSFMQSLHQRMIELGLNLYTQTRKIGRYNIPLNAITAPCYEMVQDIMIVGKGGKFDIYFINLPVIGYRIVAIGQDNSDGIKAELNNLLAASIRTHHQHMFGSSSPRGYGFRTRVIYPHRLCIENNHQAYVKSGHFLPIYNPDPNKHWDLINQVESSLELIKINDGTDCRGTKWTMVWEFTTLGLLGHLRRPDAGLESAI